MRSKASLDRAVTIHEIGSESALNFAIDAVTYFELWSFVSPNIDLPFSFRPGKEICERVLC